MTIHNRYTIALDHHCSRVACTCNWKSAVIDDSRLGHADYYSIKDASDDYEAHLTDKAWNYNANTMPVTCPRCQYSFRVNLLEPEMSDFMAEMIALLHKYEVV